MYSMTSALCARRFYSTEQPLPTPGGSTTVDPKITAIVDQIEGLTLLQTSELVAQLKVASRNIKIKKSLMYSVYRPA
jgi:large subunit ribosomal protein L7/L12